MADALTRFSLVQAGDRVLCALSGGGDSVCMTHLLASLAEQHGITLAAAHFSHGLRPESADAERELCRRLCDRLSIPLFCGEGDTAAYAKENGMGLEESARILRRNFLLETADRWGADAIATGHHLEDSAETLLFNLIRGTGGQGLQGIPPRNGRFIRPLILHSKQEIVAYLADNRLDYAEDPTNSCGDNARAVMRRQVFPALEQLNPAAARHLAQTALDNWLRDEQIRQQADGLTAQAVWENGEVSLPISALLEAEKEVAVRALQCLQRQAGGRMLERVHIEALFALCRSDDPSAQSHLPGGRALRRYDRLVLTAQQTQTPPDAVELWPHRPVDFGPWQLELREGAGEGLPLPVTDLPLIVRSRQAGDVISMPYGRKSVKKLLIDRKIPKDLRDTVPIVCNNKEIMAIGGICAAHLPGGKNFHMICRRKKI